MTGRRRQTDTVKESTRGGETDLSQRSAFQLRNGLPVNKATKQTMIYAGHLQRPRVCLVCLWPHAYPQKYFFCRRHYGIGATRDVTRDSARMRPPFRSPFCTGVRLTTALNCRFPHRNGGKCRHTKYSLSISKTLSAIFTPVVLQIMDGIISPTPKEGRFASPLFPRPPSMKGTIELALQTGPRRARFGWRPE